MPRETESQKPDGDSATEEYPIIDPLLQYFVMYANVGSMDVPVTLNVQGTVVTGRLLGINKYLDAIASIYRKPENIRTIGGRSPPEEGDEELGLRKAEETASFIDTLRIDFGKEFADTGDVKLPRLIHLQNARINGAATADGTWRGKLSSVDGFAFGAPE